MPSFRKLGFLIVFPAHILINRTVVLSANIVILLKQVSLYLLMHLFLFSIGVMLLPQPVFSLIACPLVSSTCKLHLSAYLGKFLIILSSKFLVVPVGPTSALTTIISLNFDPKNVCS
jgi:hypothetical protein